MDRTARITVVAVAAAAIALLALMGTPGRTYRHSDFFQFWAAPRLLLEGRDPYDERDWAGIYAREATAPVATPPPPRRHIYPLWTAVPLLPLGALHLELAAAVWVVAQTLAIAAALVLIARVFALGRAERVLLTGIALGFQPLWLIVGGGNVTGFVLAALALALVSVRRDPLRAGGALALVALKPHPLSLAVPALVLAADPAMRARIFAVASLGVAALVVVTMPFGAGWIPDWLRAAAERQAEPTGSNATLWTIDRVLPGAPVIAPALALALIFALVAWWRAGRAAALTLVAGAVAVSVAVAPHGWSYDQVLLLIPLGASLAHLPLLPARERVIAQTVLAVAYGVSPWLLYALAHARAGEEPSAITPVLSFALLVALAWRAAPRSPATPR